LVRAGTISGLQGDGWKQRRGKSETICDDQTPSGMQPNRHSDETA